jgi:hypothetical protein
VLSKDRSGIPNDAFRYALTAHRTRLQNNDRTHGLADEDGDILSLRIANVNRALKLYKEQQKEVLNIF